MSPAFVKSLIELASIPRPVSAGRDTIMLFLWIRKAHAIRMYAEQGKGGGISAYPETVVGFRLWLDSKMILSLIRR